MSFPFDTQKAGFKIETDFRVTEFNSYTLSFKLGYREGDAVDRERVRKLAGGPARDRAGALLKSGVAIRLRIRINALIPSDLEHAYDKEILEQRLHSSGDASFGTTIADVKLKPGTYRLMIENLEVIQELHGTAITLLVATDPKSTFRSD